VAGEKWGPIQVNYDGGIRGDYPLPQLVSESAKCGVERHLGAHI
jgi:hypothetical protein